MKLKQEPEDFRVQELIDFREARGGRFFIHLLRKRKMETLHALAVVAREAGLSSGEIGYAGLKDRQAVTTQLVSLPGRRISIRRRDLEVRFLGRSEEPISAALARGNRFELMLRALDEGELEHLARNLEEVRGSGLPNYFDDQRFGCLKHGQGLSILIEATQRPRVVEGGVAVLGIGVVALGPGFTVGLPVRSRARLARLAAAADRAGNVARAAASLAAGQSERRKADGEAKTKAGRPHGLAD